MWGVTIFVVPILGMMGIDPEEAGELIKDVVGTMPQQAISERTKIRPPQTYVFWKFGNSKVWKFGILEFGSLEFQKATLMYIPNFHSSTLAKFQAFFFQTSKLSKVWTRLHSPT